MPPTRISRCKYFLGIAKLAAERGTCHRLKVGCVLVGDTGRITTGYNSSHKGTRHCEDVGCLIHEGHCIRVLHAEEAAILKLESREHGCLRAYITHKPCIRCYKLLAGAGVNYIFYIEENREKYSEAYETLRREIQVPITKVENV